MRVFFSPSVASKAVRSDATTSAVSCSQEKAAGAGVAAVYRACRPVHTHRDHGAKAAVLRGEEADFVLHVGQTSGGGGASHEIAPDPSLSHTPQGMQ